jgi:HEAT repeat protein
VRSKILLSILLFLTIVLFYVSEIAHSEVKPIEEWKRNEEVDKKVNRIMDELEEICTKYRENPNAIGWDEKAAKLVYELKKLEGSAIPALNDIVKDKERDWNLRRIAMSRMAFTYEPAVVEPLTKFLLHKEEKLEIRVNSADLLGRILKDTTATLAMVEAMMDTTNSELLRSKIAVGFVSLHDKRTLEKLQRLAKEDENRDVRAMAVWGLGSNVNFFKDTTMTNPMIEMLEKEKDEIVRIKIIGALGITNDRRAIEPLNNLLKKKGPDYDDAIKALGNLKFRESSQLLIEYLDDDEYRVNAAEALINLEDSSAVPEIEKVLPKMAEKDSIKIKKSLDKMKRGE